MKNLVIAFAFLVAACGTPSEPNRQVRLENRATNAVRFVVVAKASLADPAPTLPLVTGVPILQIGETRSVNLGEGETPDDVAVFLYVPNPKSNPTEWRYHTAVRVGPEKWTHGGTIRITDTGATIQ